MTVAITRSPRKLAVTCAGILHADTDGNADRQVESERLNWFALTRALVHDVENAYRVSRAARVEREGLDGRDARVSVNDWRRILPLASRHHEPNHAKDSQQKSHAAPPDAEGPQDATQQRVGSKAGTVRAVSQIPRRQINSAQGACSDGVMRGAAAWV